MQIGRPHRSSLDSRLDVWKTRAILLTVQHQQKATKSNPLFLTAKGLNNILFDFEATRT